MLEWVISQNRKMCISRSLLSFTHGSLCEFKKWILRASVMAKKLLFQSWKLPFLPETPSKKSYHLIFLGWKNSLRHQDSLWSLIPFPLDGMIKIKSRFIIRIPNTEENIRTQIVSLLFKKEGTQGSYFLYCGEIQIILLKSVVETRPKLAHEFNISFLYAKRLVSHL